MMQHTRKELEQWRKDLLSDIANMIETLAWVIRELKALPPESKDRGYTRMPDTKIRDAVRKLQKATAPEVGRALGISAGQARYKLDRLYEAGTLVRIKVKGRIYFSIAKPQRSTTKTKKIQPPDLKALPGGRAVAGTGNRERRARNAQVRKGRRGHR